jgi:predicted DNA-binding transcriptional regulator YafY
MRGQTGQHQPLRPLALIFSSTSWLLAAWCEQKQSFRHFRFDRMERLDFTHEAFQDESGKDLEAYKAHESACDLEKRL